MEKSVFDYVGCQGDVDFSCCQAIWWMEEWDRIKGDKNEYERAYILLHDDRFGVHRRAAKRYFGVCVHRDDCHDKRKEALKMIKERPDEVIRIWKDMDG